MRLAWLVMVAVAAAGCSPEPTKVETDIDIERVIAETPGLTDECIRELRDRGPKAKTGPTDRCFKMTEQRRWRGLWRDEFEGSAFCPDPAEACTNVRKGGIWLTGAPGNANGKLYRVEFVGRRTLYPGPHGHLGMFKHEMIVDRMISIEAVEEE
jgi:hypothetical protein